MDKMLRILMLEDMEEDAFLIEYELKKDGIRFITQCVDTKEEFLRALDNFHPDVVLSDHALPQFNSIEALKICHKRGLSIPFLLITGTISEEFAVDCLKKGIDDYILKGNLARLPIAIRKALNQREIEQRKNEIEHSLREQNEELIKTNQELDSFVYSVSHNLRGPLATITGLVRIADLEKDWPDYKPDMYLGLINKSIKALEETISQILDYSRNARTVLKYKQVNIKMLIDNIIHEFTYLPSFDKIKVDLTIDENITVYTDQYRLSVVLRNILANAVQYMNKDKSIIRVFVFKEKGVAKITITDNGIGIEKRLLDKVFEMFFRGTDKSNGAGLGLYIARETLEKIDGEIEIKSEEKVGTKILITVPDNVNQGMQRA